MRATFPPQIANEAWELRGALEVLWDFFAHAIPADGHRQPSAPAQHAWGDRSAPVAPAAALP